MEAAVDGRVGTAEHAPAQLLHQLLHLRSPRRAAPLQLLREQALHLSLVNLEPIQLLDLLGGLPPLVLQLLLQGRDQLLSPPLPGSFCLAEAQRLSLVCRGRYLRSSSLLGVLGVNGGEEPLLLAVGVMRKIGLGDSGRVVGVLPLN